MGADASQGLGGIGTESPRQPDQPADSQTPHDSVVRTDRVLYKKVIEVDRCITTMTHNYSLLLSMIIYEQGNGTGGSSRGQNGGGGAQAGQGCNGTGDDLLTYKQFLSLDKSQYVDKIGTKPAYVDVLISDRCVYECHDVPVVVVCHGSQSCCVLIL